MTTKELERLLYRFSKNECSAEELQQLDKWFERTSERTEFELSRQDRNFYKDRIKEGIDRRITKTRFVNTPLFRVAASLMIFCSIALSLYIYRSEIRDVLDPVQYSQTIVPRGKKVKLTLSDGSVVLLNGGSALKYPVKFNRTTREVTLLEGEGYFDVAHNKEKPFIVRASGIRTRVLGTAFNVRSYREYENIQITVARGKVSVAEDIAKMKAEQAVYLLPDQQVSVERRSMKMTKAVANASEIISWTKGKLIFNNETLKNVCLRLEQSYGITIRYQDRSIENIRFTGKFDERDTLDEILFSISKANKLVYSRQGNKYLLKRPN